jgi:hypothetical protein
VLAWTSTDAGEHPNSIADGTNTTDETNTVVMTLDSLMRPLLAERLPSVAE